MMSNAKNPKPDPNRKSFWQFQSVTETDKGPVALFRHAVTRYGETSLSEGIAYPDRRTYTLEDLMAIRNAPVAPVKTLKTPKESEAHEKSRKMINLARAGLTADEFNVAVRALVVEKFERDPVVPAYNVRELKVA